MHEEVQARLDALAHDLTEELAGYATVGRRGSSGRKLVDVEPVASAALGFTWTEFLQQPEGALQVEAGHHGGRWELAATLDDVKFIEDVSRAVIAGRVVETFGPGRSRVDVTLLSGEVVSETGYVTPRGCLPLPGWVRRGRSVTYAPCLPNSR